MIVAIGTPEDIAKNSQSHTGRFLAPVLERSKQLARKRA